jgi:hypothetical protein
MRPSFKSREQGVQDACADALSRSGRARSLAEPELSHHGLCVCVVAHAGSVTHTFKLASTGNVAVRNISITQPDGDVTCGAAEAGAAFDLGYQGSAICRYVLGRHVLAFSLASYIDLGGLHTSGGALQKATA